MLRKLLIPILAVVLILGLYTGGAYAIENVGASAGSFIMMGKGQSSEFGYFTNGRFPWGINSKSLTSEGDTTVTFETVTDVMYLHSAFGAEGYAESEVIVLVNKASKSLGFLNMYFEGGLTVWNFLGASEQTDVKNRVQDGYYFGLGLTLKDSFKITGQGHAVPASSTAEAFYATGLSVTYIF